MSLGDLRNTKFLWSAKPLEVEGEEVGLEYVAIKSNRDDAPQLGGDVIVDAMCLALMACGGRQLCTLPAKPSPDETGLPLEICYFA